METYRTWVRLFELLKYYAWIVDRFHISTVVYQTNHGQRYDFSWLEERLLPLGFGIIFCTGSKESFSQAREERLKTSGKPEQYEDLSYFIREQEEFRKVISKSTLPHLEVDISENDIDQACDTIADWLVEKDLLGYYT